MDSEGVVVGPVGVGVADNSGVSEGRTLVGVGIGHNPSPVAFSPSPHEFTGTTSQV